MRPRPNRRALVVGTVLALVAALVLQASVVGVPLGDARGATIGPTVSPPADRGEPVVAPGGDGGPDRPVRSIPRTLETDHRAGERLDVYGRDAGDRTDRGAGDDGEALGRRVTLVTGETVVVRERDGDRSFEVVSGGPVHAVTAGERTYLLPEGVDLGTYDRALFDVDALLAAAGGDGGLPVLLDADASPEAIEASGFGAVRALPSAGVIAAELDPSEAGGTVPTLVEDGVVAGVSLDREVERPPASAPTTGTPVRSGDVTGAGVTVAVLDTGVDATHPDLAERIVEQVDLVDRNGDEGSDADGSDADGSDDERDESPVDGPGTNRSVAANATEVAPDSNGHGTLVAGVLAGTGSGDGARAGVAPGASLLDVRVMDDRGAGRASTIIEGIELAVERDVDVILLSVGTSIDGSHEIAESVEWATERGVAVVAAAGNEGNLRTIGAPGRPAGAITVGATEENGDVASYSSRGPTLDGRLKPDVVAPGGGIVGPRSSNSDRPGVGGDDRYTRMSGTSAAAPQVAGAAALLLETEPELSADEVVARLGSTARPVDGAHAFAQGSGEVDVERALAPDVVVSDPAIDFGLVADDGTRNRTVTVTNHDDRTHELTFDVRVRNVDLGRDADGTASLSRTDLTLEPGERANLTLSVSGETASGAHAGEVRYSVAGDPRSVAFGFVRGGPVTVEKRPYTAGSSVEGDELWVLAEEGTHDELLEFRDGSASFVAGGGTYLLWSWGTDESTGTIAFVSKRRSFDRPTHVVLDEGETVPVGVDAGPLEARYGPLENRLLTVSASSDYGDGVARLTVSRHDVESREVRASPDPELSVAATYLLTTPATGPAELDVADVFQLAHGVDGVRGPSVVEAHPEELTTTVHRLRRTTVDETYHVQDRIVVDGVWNQITRRWFDLGGRATQRLHRSPGAAYHRAFRGEGWRAHRDARGDASANADVLAHPMHGHLDAFSIADGALTVTGTPFADGAGTRFAPSGDRSMTVSIDGAVVREERIPAGRGTVADLSVESGQDVTVRIVGENPDGFLSTRTLTEVSVPDYRPVGDRYPVDPNRPPIVTNVSVPGSDGANAVEPGEVTAVFEVDAVGTLVNPVVWYAAGGPAEPPWENRSAWERAETERVGDRLHATFHVEEGTGTASLAAAVGDVRGHRTRTMTADAFHVGEAPNTSTSVLAGRLLTEGGSAADNDTVVVEPVEEGDARYVSTDGDGRFAVELPRDRDYELTYLRGEPWVASEPSADGRPAWFPLDRVHVADDVDLGTRSLPEAGELVVDVSDARGEPVAGAAVRVSQRVENGSVAERLETGEDGLARRAGVDRAGIELAGTVELAVEPPDDELYPERAYGATVTLEGSRAVSVTVETAPPTAALAAFGTFEPGEVVFLHARRSDVPAGAAEYRWDVDGDGETDLVTDEPIVRRAYDAGTHRPSVTVVDEAGETDEATLLLRVDDDGAR